MTLSYPPGSLGQTLKGLGKVIAANPQSSIAATLRPAPANDNQPDFFVPSLCDIALKDGIGLMDIACFRLGSRATQRVIRHDLPGVTVEVAGGSHELCANLGDGGLRRRRIVAGVQPARTSRGAIRREERYNRYLPASAEIV